MAFKKQNENINRLYVDYDTIDQHVGGRLWLWGSNYYGMLGTNDTDNRSSPVQTIAGGTNWKSIACSQGHVVAIKTDGTLWGCGRGGFGELGDNIPINKSSPVQTVTGGTNWKQVSAKNYHTCAIKTDGTLWGWGTNSSGQLGTNETATKYSPIQTVAGGTNWKLVNCGRFTTAAIKTDGTLWTWGNNTNGQLGTNDLTSRSSPAQTVASGNNWKLVNSGWYHIGAIKTDGTLWLWGQNDSGALGTNNTTNRSSPVQTIAGGTNWKQVSCGYRATAAIKTDGTLWLWGGNAYGSLGTNDITSRSSPTQVITGGTDWKQVATSGKHTAAVKTDGTLWVWGSNASGELGINNLDDFAKSSPVQTIKAGNSWKSVACWTDNGSGFGVTVATTFSDID
jgi:alpha-tubulin suppressor-like RCC1 family protein